MKHEVSSGEFSNKISILSVFIFRKVSAVVHNLLTEKVATFNPFCNGPLRNFIEAA